MLLSQLLYLNLLKMPITLPPRIMWSAVTNPENKKNWVLLRFASKKTLEILGSGTGGRAECVANLRENEVLFGGFVVYGVDSRGGVTSKRAKFVHFAWVGPNVPIMQRSRASTNSQDVSDWFGGAHMSIRSGPDIDDLAEVEIVQRLLSSGGAHKPKLYDFGGNLGARTPDDIMKGPSETSDGGGSGDSAGDGEAKEQQAKKKAPAPAPAVVDIAALKAAESAAEKKRTDEAAAAEIAAQDAAEKAKLAAKKREEELAAAEAASAKTEKAEKVAREKAADAAKTSAENREATTKTPIKKRRASLSEVKAAELMGNSGPRAVILTSSIGGSAVESKERKVKGRFKGRCLLCRYT